MKYDHVYDIEFQKRLLTSIIKDPDIWESVYRHLEVWDFGVSYLQLVFDLAKSYYEEFSGLPSIGTLSMLVGQVVDGNNDITSVRTHSLDYTGLAEFLEEYGSVVVEESDRKYFKEIVPNFITTVRYYKIQSTGLSPHEKLEAFEDLKNQAAAAKASRFVFVPAMSEVKEDAGAAGGRFLLGVRSVDPRVGNGIGRGEGCLFVAPTGVGKTNSMLGSMSVVSRMGEHALFIALEMSTPRLQERYHGILGGIPANYFKIPKNKWPSTYIRRLNYLMSPACDDVRSRGTILNLSGESRGYNDIHEAIKMWKQMVYDEEGLDPDKVCTTVYIDWLKRMTTDGIRVSRDAKTHDVYGQICGKLNDIWLEENVRMFINTQATGASKGKELLTTFDIAEGKDFANQMDLVIGLAPSLAGSDPSGGGLTIKTSSMDPYNYEDDDDLDSDFKIYSETDISRLSECDRTLNVCFMKTRDSSEVDNFVPVYQDATLRLWSNKAEAFKRKRLIEQNPERGLN